MNIMVISLGVDDLYLKRIEMQGFKSFADKIVIDVGRGVTGIVGPNGSGKSNISDALRWVMGEQSAKSLRSGKMEDVIFNGTQKRKPLSFAEVTLVLDNESHFFDSEYKELAVTRRVFRSGESEYLINGAQCRLKDVHELFMDTGLGREGYSVVGQGKIDEIISAKSEDRRQVFEEASGISKYRHRKTEAERKLERTEENLVRVRDILTELSGRVEPLRKQSEKARKYLDLREELKGIEVSSSVDIIDKNKDELEKNARLLETASCDYENERKKLLQAEAESEELYAAMRETDEKTGRMREELDAMRSELAEKKSKAALLQNNIENYKKNIFAAENEEAANEKAIENEKKLIERAAEEKREAESRIESEKRQLALMEENGRRLTDEMVRRGREVEEVRQNIRQCEKQLSEAESSSKGLDILAESIETRKIAIEQDIKASYENEKKLHAETERIEQELEQAVKDKNESAEMYGSASAEAEKTARSAEEKKDEFNHMSSMIGEKQGRLRMLEEMERSLEGYQRSVRDLINAHKAGRYTGNITGIFSKLITVPRQYNVAIEIALGGAMQNVIVPTEEDAKEAVNYLKANRLGRVTFLPLSSQEKRRLENEARILAERGVIGVAADLVERDNYLDNTVEALLGRVIVTDNQDNAIRLAKAYKYRFKIVTLSGEEFRVGGSITGGSINRAVSVLGRAEEIEALKKEVKSLSKSAEKAEDDIAVMGDRVRALARTREEMRMLLSEKEVVISRLEAERNAVNVRLEEEKERRARLRAEKDEKAASLLNNSELKQDRLLEKEKAKSTLELMEEELRQRQTELNDAMERKDKASSEIFEQKMAIANVEKDIAMICERERIAAEHIKSLEAENEAKRAAAKSLAENAESTRKLIEAENALSAEIDEKINKLECEVKSAVLGKSGKDEKAARLRDEIRRMNDTVYALQNETARLESVKSKLDYNIENAVNRLWDEYEMTYSAAKECYRPGMSIAESQKKIASLRGAIRALGNVNVDAVEEYLEVKERYDFLSAQVSDLDDAKSQLEKLIGEITTVMKDIFAQKFKVINTYFGEIFKELFGGGNASVSLTDKNNILDSGIDIEVQPPGKKLQSIAPLSGGEKALTAIALLFALMKVSPSPFVVLDEIEAALDDINVYRFADYMRRRTDMTQFVVITHRRGTMESADVLYGVTMQEKGVSKLLSMKLEDVKEYQEV